MSAPISFTAFVSSVLSVTLTPAQRVFALVAFDGVDPIALRGAERDLARRLFGRVTTIPAMARAIVALLAGARSGKTWLSSLRLLHFALTADLSSLAPGEIAISPIVSTDLRVARQALRFIEGALDASDLALLIVARSADAITICRPDGRRVTFECFPATRGGSAVRGRWLCGGLISEAAFLRDADFIVNDAEIFAAMSPRILPGTQLLVESTPWVAAGLLFELHRDNFGKPTTAIAVHAPTLLLRDNHPDVVATVARERKRDPKNAAREYDAQFIDGESSLLRSADVDACTDPIDNRPPRRDVVYGMTLDVGLRNDSTVALVFHVEATKREGAPPVSILVVDAVRELRPAFLRRVSLDEVEEMIFGLANRYRIARVHADLHFADAIAPRLRARGLSFVEMPMTPTAQETRGMSIVARFASRSIRLVRHATLLKQCKEVRIVRHSGGRISIGAAESKKKHDDAFDCLLLAAEVARTMRVSGGNIECVVGVNRIDSHFDFTQQWFERKVLPNGHVVRLPAGPPVGTRAWIELRRSQKAQGVVIPGEPDPDDFCDTPDDQPQAVRADRHVGARERRNQRKGR